MLDALIVLINYKNNILLKKNPEIYFYGGLEN